MDAEQIRRLEPQLADYLDCFEDCLRGGTRRRISPCTCEDNFRSCRGRAWNRWRWQQAPRCGRCKSS